MPNTSNEWRTIISGFASELESRPGCHSVKALCGDFAIQWGSMVEYKEYLKDYLEVSRRHLWFHNKWKIKLSLDNIVAYDNEEIALVGELISRLKN